MDIRHLVTKSFDNGNDIRKSIIYNGVPLVIQMTSETVSAEKKEITLVLDKSLPEEISLSKELQSGKDTLLNSPIKEIISKDDEILPLSQLYDYKVTSDSIFSQFLPVGADFDSIVKTNEVKDLLKDTAFEMFPNDNPKTGSKDIQPDKFYVEYIPLTILTGIMTPQSENDKVYFNPEGTVSIAEFLDSLNAIKYGCNSNLNRKRSIDNISGIDDYFNEGYRSCLRGIASPFYNLYTRQELVKPITRLELAYITVVCWNKFIDEFNGYYSGSYYLGVNLDWEHPAEILSKFKDGFDYKVSKVVIDQEYDTVSLNVKDYKLNNSMSEFIERIRVGKSAIPLPMFMSILELFVLDLFYFEDDEISPLKEVSRGELCYFVSKLAKTFPTKYIK